MFSATECVFMMGFGNRFRISVSPHQHPSNSNAIAVTEGFQNYPKISFYDPFFLFTNGYVNGRAATGDERRAAIVVHEWSHAYANAVAGGPTGSLDPRDEPTLKATASNNPDQAVKTAGAYEFYALEAYLAP